MDDWNTKADEAIEMAAKDRPRMHVHNTILMMANSMSRVSNMIAAAMHAERSADLAPALVLQQSFMVELLLKFFLAIDHPGKKHAEILARGVAMSGHTYSQIFDRITDSHRENIAVEFSRQMGEIKTQTDFRQALVDLGDDPFIRWRYAYEAKANIYLDLRLLKKVANSLGTVAQGMARELRATESKQSTGPDA